MAEGYWRAVALGMLGLALVPAAAAMLGEPYYVDLFTRIMIFGIAALSLDLILGYGGMISFNHAIYLGLGGYAVGILSYYGITNGFLHFAVAVLVSALVALLTGAVSLRTSGVHFIMITLAFGQMFYFLGISIEKFGGDDGLNIASRSDLAGLVDLNNAAVLYYFVFASLLFVLWIGRCIIGSRFGMVISGVKFNERRMAAIGFATFRYRLAAYVISGAICGFAGALLANQALFVSPAIMNWSRSGEVMVMVILGGMSTLFGPVLGAVVYLMLEDVLSGFTAHWQIVFGPFLVAVVLFARGGIVGLVRERLRSARRG